MKAEFCGVSLDWAQGKIDINSTVQETEPGNIRGDFR